MREMLRDWRFVHEQSARAQHAGKPVRRAVQVTWGLRRCSTRRRDITRTRRTTRIRLIEGASGLGRRQPPDWRTNVARDIS